MSDTRMLGERYEVGEVLGRGGMATVRRARDHRLLRDVAIKELRIDLASDATFQERFRREAHAAGGLNHPNIVSVYDTGEEPDPASGVSIPYIVMELVSGRTLRDLLRDGRPILPRRALEFTLGVLEALSYSHKAGIVHRDIKPANVMITPTGIVKVMDFGIARAVADTSSTMTQTAAVIGTAQYLSPEQARGETVDHRSDLYSAGCLLYELLVGRPPFTGDSPVSVAYQHVREAPTPPSQLDAEVTPAMDAIVLKSLAKNPADRYQSASDMIADIRRLLAGEEVHAAPPLAVPAAAAVAAPLAAAATAVMPEQTMGGAPAYPPTAQLSPQRVDLSPRTPEGVPAGRRRRWLWPVTGLLLLALVAVTLLVFFLPKTPQVAVPSVTKVEQSIAEYMIRDKNLNPKVKQVQGPEDATRGSVTDQDPAAGTLVDPGSDVTITVNIGPSKQILPAGILGQDVTYVQQQLKAAGFTNVRPEKASSEPATAKANVVLTVDPAEGSPVSPGQLITLYYATGQAAVPAIGNYDKDVARQLCEQAGFTNVVFKPQSSNATPNSVIASDPAPGTVMNKSDLLTITYAVPPATTTATVTKTVETPPPTTSTTPTAKPTPSKSTTPTPGG